MTTPAAGQHEPPPGRPAASSFSSSSFSSNVSAAAASAIHSSSHGSPKRRHTLLLCFIHGFKGDADTFGPGSRFAHELRQRVAASLPRVDVRTAVYPPYQTRGDLAATVARVADWLLDAVIDLEVAARTPSPTVEPSVRCVLIGHSMGGIVAADVLLSLVTDRRVMSRDDEDGGHAALPELNGLMFPYVQGVLGFDTPFLGIAPGVVAHGAQEKYTATSAAITQLSSLTESLWGKKSGAAGAAGASGASGAAATKALPATASTTTTTTPISAWGWGKIAMVAGAGALASGAAAAVAYHNRDHLTEGWSWVSSHLEFVGCLARGEDLRRRIARVRHAHRQLGVGFGNLYTRLGKAASSKQTQTQAQAQAGVGSLLLLPSERTFCNLPSREPAGEWREAVNDAATDETGAHMSMFAPATNPNYDRLLADARDMVVHWTLGSEWYETSSINKAPAP